jgi:hypothetical protein
MAGAAQDYAPEISTPPEPRPDDLTDPEMQVPADEPMADATGAIVAAPTEPPIRTQLRETEDAFTACLAALDALGTVYETGAAVTDDGIRDCGVARPVRVTEVVPGVALSPEGVMRCETARALADWTATILQPAARTLPERGVLTTLEQGSTYICRPRNNRPGGKLSEHSFGNAVDIEAFQRTARAGSCLYFTTVLGPGTDAAHADHLHMDIKARNGGFRLCQ